MPSTLESPFGHLGTLYNSDNSNMTLMTDDSCDFDLTGDSDNAKFEVWAS